MIAKAVPALNYSEAERVGVALRKRWYGLTGKRRRPQLQDEQWADMVQFVLRQAAEQVNARAE